MSNRRATGNVVWTLPELELVLEARNWLSDPDKWMQGHFGKGRRKCWAGQLLKAGAQRPRPDCSEAGLQRLPRHGWVQRHPIRMQTYWPE